MTSIIACESTEGQPGFWREYEGSVQDWLTQSQRSAAIQAKALVNQGKTSETSVFATPAAKPETLVPNKSAAKLSYKEQRELNGLPDRISALEKEQLDLRAELADGSLFAKDAAKASQLYARDAAIDDELLAALERMEELGQR